MNSDWITNIETPDNSVLALGALFIGLYVIADRLYRYWRNPRRRRHTFHIRQAKRVIDRLAELPSNAHRLAYLRKIHPLTFEELLLETAKRRGHKVYRNKRYTGDGGIDGRIKMDGELFLIQAKRYSGHIDSQHLADFCRLVEINQCSGLFCHTGRTGKGARAIPLGRVSLVSGEKLLRFIGVEDATMKARG